MPNWKTLEFQELAASGRFSFSIGPFGSAITKENYISEGIPVVRGVNLARGIFIDDEFVYISSAKAEDLASANVVAGDLVFTHRGTIGQVSMVPRSPRYERYVLSSSQVKARLDLARAVPEFYYYWFRSRNGQNTLLANASTVGVPGIASPLATLKSLRVPFPPLDVQEAVASVLGALDEKIAANDNVASSASALLKAYFTASMKSIEHKVRLHEIIYLHYGKALTKVTRAPGPIPVYGGNGISGWHQHSLANGPGIVVGRKGANAGSVSWSQGPFWAIDTAFYAEPKVADISHEFIFFLLDSVGLRSLVGDSAIPGLNREIALSCEALLPPGNAIAQFTSQAKALLPLVAHMDSESRALADLRDTLLPKLMSGEIRVMDAEKVVKDAT